MWKMAGVAPTKTAAAPGIGTSAEAWGKPLMRLFGDGHPRGTWLSFGNKDTLVIAIEDDPRLINRYDVIELNPHKHPNAELGEAKILANWLASPDGQKAIGGYHIDGQRLFNPSATKRYGRGPRSLSQTDLARSGEIREYIDFVIWPCARRYGPSAGERSATTVRHKCGGAE